MIFTAGPQTIPSRSISFMISETIEYGLSGRFQIQRSISPRVVEARTLLALILGKAMPEAANS